MFFNTEDTEDTEDTEFSCYDKKLCVFRVFTDQSNNLTNGVTSPSPYGGRAGEGGAKQIRSEISKTSPRNQFMIIRPVINEKKYYPSPFGLLKINGSLL